MTEHQTIKITTRTRIAYACTSDAEQTPQGLRVKEPDVPWGQVCANRLGAAVADARRACGGGPGGCDTRVALWVRGMRVVAPRAVLDWAHGGLGAGESIEVRGRVAAGEKSET